MTESISQALHSLNASATPFHRGDVGQALELRGLEPFLQTPRDRCVCECGRLGEDMGVCFVSYGMPVNVWKPVSKKNKKP